MLRAELSRLIESAVASLIVRGDFPEAIRAVPVEISDTKNPEHGDYACNFAMVATKTAGMPPRRIAELLAEALVGEAGDPLLLAVEVAGPGFLNLKLRPEAVARWVEWIRGRADRMAEVENSAPERINIEFVSVNPNGPITVGSGRGAAFGDSLARVLAAAGNVVHREYYINDGVNSEQMRRFAQSVQFKAMFADHAAEEAFREKSDAVSTEFGRWWNLAADAFNTAAGTGHFDDGQDWFDHQWVEFLANHPEFSESCPDLAQTETPKFRQHTLQHYQFFDLPYKGDYLRPIADKVRQELGNNYSLEQIRDLSEQWMIQRQRDDLDHFGVRFDTWFSEQSLHESGEVARTTSALIANHAADDEPYRTKVKFARGGAIEDVEREDQPDDTEDDDGAGGSATNANGKTLWLRSTKFGDDMDRVLRRRDGRLTYITSDVAYHADKFNRPAGATKLITVLGPDHHGYISRLRAVLAALRLPETLPAAGTALNETDAKIYRTPEERDACLAALDLAKRQLDVVIFQIVRFVKDGKPAPMRKRDGNIYELRDLIDELGKNIKPDGTDEEQRVTGKDVARFFYLMRSHDTHMDFDIDLATKQSDDNPVFYVQYAHARICSVIDRAAAAGIAPPEATEKAPYHLLVHPRETALIKKILDLPFEVERAAKDHGVHRLTTYSVELARTYHHFYDVCRVIQPDQPDLSIARLALCEAAKMGLAAALELLGVSAPERMDRHERPTDETA